MLNENATQLPTGAFTLNNLSLTSIRQKSLEQKSSGDGHATDKFVLENALKNIAPLDWDGQQAVLNRSMLERLNELDSTGDLTKKLIGMYFEFSAHTLDELCRRVAVEDHENVQNEIARHIHSLKSSSGNLGLDRVSAILQHIEHANLTGDAFARSVRLLAVEITKGNSALAEWLNTH